jgi:hypothetical protein
MTLSLERMARLLLGILTTRGVNRTCIPRLDLMTLNARDLADLNLPADVRSRFIGQREALDLRRRV